MASCTNVSLVLDVGKNTWTQHTSMPNGTLMYSPDAVVQGVYAVDTYGPTNSGSVYRLFTGTTDEGAAIAWYWRSKDVVEPMDRYKEVRLVRARFAQTDESQTGSSYTIVSASSASPIVITLSSAPGWVSGDYVLISGVQGNTAANGIWVVATGGSTTEYSLVASVGTVTATNKDFIQPSCIKSGGSSIQITAATNASPIEITTISAHGYSDHDIILVSGVVGNTNANGRWTIHTAGTTKFTLEGSTGNAAMTQAVGAKLLNTCMLSVRVNDDAADAKYRIFSLPSVSANPRVVAWSPAPIADSESVSLGVSGKSEKALIVTKLDADIVDRGLIL